MIVNTSNTACQIKLSLVIIQMHGVSNLKFTFTVLLVNLITF